ncbi:MAG: hypothetical protein V4572_02175 [Bacteroidota bacterium]
MKTKLSLLILTLFLLFSCATSKTAEDEKLKTKLIGTWSGSEANNQKVGITKHWIQIRNKSGTYILLYTAIENCEVSTFVEKGKWWVKDGLFYEVYEGKGKADVYAVEVLDGDNLKFKAKEISVDMDNKEYEFFETREE